MKRVIQVMIVLGLSLVLFVIMVNCGKSDKEALVGKYVSQINPNEYMEIKKGGKLYVKEEAGGYAGKWKLEGDEVIFYNLPLGLVVKGKIKGKRIKDNMGITWVRTSGDVARGRQRPERGDSGDKDSHNKELGGKEESILGKYVYQKDPDVYMEIKKNGILYVKEKNHDYPAKWKMEGDEVIFYELGGGLVVKGKVKGNRIKDSEGNTWTRVPRDVASSRERNESNESIEEGAHYKELEEIGKKIRQDKEMEEVGRRVRESMSK